MTILSTLLADAWDFARRQHPDAEYYEDRFEIAYDADKWIFGGVYEVGVLTAVDYKRRLVHVSFCVPELGSLDINPTKIAVTGATYVFKGLANVGLFVPDFLPEARGIFRWVDSPAEIEFGPALTVRTNAVHVSEHEIAQAFKVFPGRVTIVSEGDLHQSVFIIYGELDEERAKEINEFLKAHNVKTWFYPDNSLPGQKLHRMMHDGVNTHDRVLLICSQSSLSRSGVLNELERVFEREARQGGDDILIPVTIDDYVFNKWTPARQDVAQQVRTRVITTIPASELDPDGFLREMAKLQKALKK